MYNSSAPNVTIHIQLFNMQDTTGELGELMAGFSAHNMNGNIQVPEADVKIHLHIISVIYIGTLVGRTFHIILS